MSFKILVGITLQENSRRLIDKGVSLSKVLDAPLHILHIRQGNTIFDHPDSSVLLTDLFAYGGEAGGEVHFLCSDNIPKTITDFIKQNKITHLVIGESPEASSLSSSSIYDILKAEVDHIELHVLARELPYTP